MNTRVKRLAALILVTAVAGIGCDTEDVATPEQQTHATEKTPDRSETTSRMTAHFYQPGNPFTATTLERLVERRDVQRVLGQFLSIGLDASPGECFVIEAITEDATMTATFIPMQSTTATSEAGLLGCFERGDEMVLAPVTFELEPYSGPITGTGMNAAPFDAPTASPEDTQRWNPEQWNRFWQCILVQAPGSAGVCTTTCTLAGTLWFNHCTLLCLATESFMDVVHCVYHVNLTEDGHGGRRPAMQ